MHVSAILLHESAGGGINYVIRPEPVERLVHTEYLQRTTRALPDKMYSVALRPQTNPCSIEDVITTLRRQGRNPSDHNGYRESRASRTHRKLPTPEGRVKCLFHDFRHGFLRILPRVSQLGLFLVFFPATKPSYLLP